MRALVTGGGSGIGAAVAHRLADDGFDVTVADLQPDAVATDLGATALRLDVRDEAAVAAAMDGVEVLVNAAGHRLDDGRARHDARGLGGRLRRERARNVPLLQARDPGHEDARWRRDRQRRVGRWSRRPQEPRRLLRVERRGDRADSGSRCRPRRRRDPRQRRLPRDDRHAVGATPRRRRRRVARRAARAAADGAPRDAGGGRGRCALPRDRRRS